MRCCRWLVPQEVSAAPARPLTHVVSRLGAFTGAARMKRLALKLMVAAASSSPGALQNQELNRLRVSWQHLQPLPAQAAVALGVCCWCSATCLNCSQQSSEAATQSASSQHPVSRAAASQHCSTKQLCRTPHHGG
jgi:hypothetical protein